jgi:hypothetical protein
MAFIAAAGLILSAVSSIKAGSAAKNAADANVGISLINQELIEKNAELDEQILRRQQQKTIGSIRASIGASGVRLEGSPLEVLAESVAAAETDIRTLQFNARTRLKGERIGASMEKQRGRDAQTAGIIGGASSLLSASQGFSGSGGQPRAGNPFITKSNPLGLTPGQGL